MNLEDRPYMKNIRDCVSRYEKINKNPSALIGQKMCCVIKEAYGKGTFIAEPYEFVFGNDGKDDPMFKSADVSTIKEKLASMKNPQ